MMLEPHDLDDLTPTEALKAVHADIRDHPVQPGPGGLFTAVRHIDLLAHLTTRFSGDALHILELDDHNPQTARRLAEAHAIACTPITQALAHYGQALNDVLYLDSPPGSSAPAPLDLLVQQGRVHALLQQARATFAHAHNAFCAPSRPAPGTTPGTTAPGTPAAPESEPPRAGR
jgi:hypothetical protein